MARTETLQSKRLRRAMHERRVFTRRVEDTLGGFPDITAAVVGGVRDGAQFLVETKSVEKLRPWGTGTALRDSLTMKPTQWIMFLTWPGELYVAAWGRERTGDYAWWLVRAFEDPNQSRPMYTSSVDGVRVPLYERLVKEAGPFDHEAAAAVMHQPWTTDWRPLY